MSSNGDRLQLCQCAHPRIKVVDMGEPGTVTAFCQDCTGLVGKQRKNTPSPEVDEDMQDL